MNILVSSCYSKILTELFTNVYRFLVKIFTEITNNLVYAVSLYKMFPCYMHIGFQQRVMDTSKLDICFVIKILIQILVVPLAIIIFDNVYHVLCTHTQCLQ